MIGVQGDINRLAGGSQNTGKLRADLRGIGNRHACMQTEDFHMIDGFEPGHDLREPPRRQGQRIAAGQNHFPDCRMLLDIADGASGERCDGLFGPTTARRKQNRQ